MGTNFNYDDTSHRLIFDHLNGGAGSDALQQNGQAWQQLGGEIGGTGKSFVDSAMRVILATRQGAAADADAAQRRPARWAPGWMAWRRSRVPPRAGHRLRLSIG